VELPISSHASRADTQPTSGSGTGDTAFVARQTLSELSPVATPIESAAPLSSGRGSILIVEDNPDMNRFIKETLADRYEVVSAFNGREGLEKALEMRPDVILTDIMMPEMSGDQLVREARARPHLNAVPILVLTAKADDESCVRMLRDGAQDYLRKPFSAEELHAAFRTGAFASPEAAKHRHLYREKFCEYDDGRAAERVVRRVFLGETDVPPIVPLADRKAAPSPHFMHNG